MGKNQAIEIDSQSLEILNELMQTYPESASQLPRLKMETQKDFENPISKWIEQLHRWLLDRIPQGAEETTEKGVGFTVDLFENIILIVVALIIAYFLARFFLNRADDFSEEGEGFRGSKELHLKELRQLIDRKEFKRALRLRWKIFLNRFQLSEETTPSQYLSIEKDLPESRKKFILESYIKMFSIETTNQSSYSELDSVLSDLELKRTTEQS